MNWLKNNMWAIPVIALFINGGIQWEQMRHARSVALEVSDRLRQHELNRDIHANRWEDDRRWADLMRRLERIENKLDSR